MEHKGCSTSDPQTFNFLLKLCLPIFQISLLVLGAFATDMVAKTPQIPSHPAYSNPNLPSQQRRRWFVDPGSAAMLSDPKLAIERFYELASLENPPMRLVLGKDCIVGVRRKLKSMAGEVDTYESWSECLGRQ